MIVTPSICIFLLLCPCSSGWSQQQPVLIQGTVFDGQTGRPIPGVQVTLERTIVLTDSDGRFVLQNVRPGSHNVSFARSGYVRSAAISDSQNRNLLIGMTRAGSVSGRLTDERGEALEGIQIQLLRRVYDEYGIEGHLDSFSARTDDRGEYRLYWVTPGTYLVTAQLMDSPEGPENSNAPVRYRYYTSIYPGVMDTADAAHVNVTAGAEVSGINWSLRTSPDRTQYSIRGRVIDSRTGTVGGSQVTLSKLTPEGASDSAVNADSEGLFEFKDIHPGTYWLGAVSRQAGAPSATRVEIKVLNQDIDGLTLTMTPGITISGRMMLEGPFTATDRLGIRLQPIAASTASPPPPRRVQADGTFAIDSVTPGLYRLVVTSLPAECFVREARLGLLDVLGQPIVITETTSGSLQVVVSSNSGELDGIVLDARRQPVPGIETVLIPDQHRERKTLYLKTRTNDEGRFALQGIPPGNYKVFAWERLDPYGYFDLAAVQQADTQGTPVRVTEFSTQTIEVRSIP